VTLASVVAIPNIGPAVSTLTNPDGSYTIQGLPPNSYQVYVHPLPPDAIVAGGEGLQLPQNDNGQQIGAGSPFRTVFYPGVLDPAQATQFNVNPGSSQQNVNFSVQTRSGVPAYNLATYSYLDPNSRTYPANPGASSATYITPTPAFIDATQPQAVVTVQGIPPATTPLAQKVTMLGIGDTYFTSLFNNNTWMVLYFAMQPSSISGPRHLVFNFGNDIYVLPDAVNMVQKGPPQVTGVTASGDGTVTVNGNGFNVDSRVFFDGMPAAGIYNGAGNNITVTPPSGAPGQISTVAVYQSDSQNSLLLQSQNPPTYTYPNNASAQIQNITPSSLSAGLSAAPFMAKVDIVTAGTQFIDGQVSVGFGSSDVAVSRVWVLGPNHLVANVVVAPGAALGSFEVSIISGMQVISQPNAFQLQSASPMPQVAALVNGETNQASALYLGNAAVLYGSNLGQFGATQLTVNGVLAQVLFVSASQINFVVPSAAGIGPATLVVNNGFNTSTVEVQLANLPPAITSVNGGSGGGSANPGDILTVTLAGLDNAIAASPSRLQVTVAGLPMPLVQSGFGQLEFVLTQSFGGTQVPIIVWADGAPSAPFFFTAR
jgi:hypothetical protein